MIKKLNSLCLSLIAAVLLCGVASGASVNIMHGWPAQQGEVFNRIVKVFEKKHPDIEVVVEVVGRDRPAVLAARAGGYVSASGCAGATGSCRW